MNTKKFLRLNKACEKYGIGRRTLDRWIHDGMITRYKLGGSSFVDQDEIDRKIMAGRAS